MSSGYGFWSDTSIGGFLNAKVSKYLYQIFNIYIYMFKQNYFLFSLYAL